MDDKWFRAKIRYGPGGSVSAQIGCECHYFFVPSGIIVSKVSTTTSSPLPPSLIGDLSICYLKSPRVLFALFVIFGTDFATIYMVGISKFLLDFESSEMVDSVGPSHKYRKLDC